MLCDRKGFLVKLMQGVLVGKCRSLAGLWVWFGLSFAPLPLEAERYDEADKALLKALSLNNQNIVILNSLGRLNHELRKSKEAEIFGSQDTESEKNHETKEPEMFEKLDSEEDFEIPAFLRKQKN